MDIRPIDILDCKQGAVRAVRFNEDGFVQAKSDNLPKIDALMIGSFFASSDLFNSAEIRGKKLLSSGRESYGDNSIGWAQVKRQGSLCTVKTKICPEHKVRAKNYNATLTVDEVEEKILEVLCDDCAASLGGCKHAVAFLMWCHRRSEEPSPTEVVCYWKKSKLSTVGSLKKFVTLADFEVIGENPLPCPSNGSFLNRVVSAGIKKGASSQLLKHFSVSDTEP